MFRLRPLPRASALAFTALALTACADGFMGIGDEDAGQTTSAASSAPPVRADSSVPPSRIDRHFSRLDRDGDGSISWGEAMTRHQRVFSRADTDGDGIVTRAEYVERSGDDRRRARRDQRFRLFDSDGDGTVSRSEFMEAHHRMFQSVDADGDGAIVRQEVSQVMRQKR